MARAYWIDLFSVETWKEFLDHGGSVSGFTEKRRTVASRIRPGDYLLCYLTGASRWIGLLEAVSELFFDEEPIWSSAVFPCRVRVKVILALAPEHGVPVLDMRGQLSVFEGLDNPNHWQGPFRASPRNGRPQTARQSSTRCERQTRTRSSGRCPRAGSLLVKACKTRLISAA